MRVVNRQCIVVRAGVIGRSRSGPQRRGCAQLGRSLWLAGGGCPVPSREYACTSRGAATGRNRGT